MPELILNIETSTDVCAVSLQDGSDFIGERVANEPMSHTRMLTVLIETLLKECDVSIRNLSAVAVSAGPGSYTGLRVGVSTAKGICYAGGLPLIAVSTLRGIADKMIEREGKNDRRTYYVPMLDARRMEVYTALYDGAGREIHPIHALILEEKVFSSYLEEVERIVVGGPGADKFVAHFKPSTIEHMEVPVRASNMIPAAWRACLNKDFVDLAYFEPHYLKSPNITISKKSLF